MPTLIAPPGKIILKKYTEKTVSGIVVPEGEKGESRIGVVYAFGEKRKDDPEIILTVGDKVIFKKYVSNSLYVAGINEKFDFVEYDDIVAVFKND